MIVAFEKFSKNLEIYIVRNLLETYRTRAMSYSILITMKYSYVINFTSIICEPLLIQCLNE